MPYTAASKVELTPSPPDQVRLDRDRLQNQRKESWRGEAELRARVEGLQAELKKRRNQVVFDVWSASAGAREASSTHTHPHSCPRPGGCSRSASASCSPLTNASRR